MTQRGGSARRRGVRLPHACRPHTPRRSHFPLTTAPVFRARTKKSFEQFRKDLILELKGTWASFFVTWEWRDHACYLKSWGARGFAKLENDIVTTELNLESWPATWPWFSDKMVYDVKRMTEGASEYSRLQEEEYESRIQIKNAAIDRLKKCRDRELESERSLQGWQIFDDITRVLVAVTGTGSAASLWSFQQLHKLSAVLIGTAAGLSAVQAALRASDQIKDWSDLKGHFVRLRIDLETFLHEMEIRPDFQVVDFEQRLTTYERRYADGEVLWRTDVLSWLWSGISGVTGLLVSVTSWLSRKLERQSPNRSDVGWGESRPPSQPVPIVH